MVRHNPSGSVQRSFRLSRKTTDLLDSAASMTGESRNALADRLLGEALRLERHPLIRFQVGAGGRRQPLVVGTRLYVHQVLSTVRSSKGDAQEAAKYLGVPLRLVRAAIDYGGEFVDEVEEDARIAQRFEEDDQARRRGQQRALA